MTSRLLMILSFYLFSTVACAQDGPIKIKSKKFKAPDGVKVEGEVGYLTVPENRSNPDARNIKVKFIRLKSFAKQPKAPIIYLEGGNSPVTWQAEDPKHLKDWLPLLQVADLIFVDQRGSTNNESLIHVWKGEYPDDFMTTEEGANRHYQQMSKVALLDLKEKGVDVAGYTVTEHAQDIQAVAKALNINQYSLFGFSFGSHIGMAVMKMYPESVTNAIFVGADALNQSFNYPSHLDDHVLKVAALVAKDSILSQTIPNFQLLVENVMTKLDKQPVTVNVKHPLTRKGMEVKVGRFGLSMILRLDIDDTNDLPVIPRLLYSIDQGDYAMLQWFVQKRIAFLLAVPGNGINQALASGVSEQRWEKIEDQAAQNPYGNVVNFPFAAARVIWPAQQLSFDAATPLLSDIPTLFITGDLDCRTPVEQVNETMKGFQNATHLVVQNAGHEQALWNVKIFDQAIPAFLLGEDVSEVKTVLKKIQFLPLTGPTDEHPSTR